MKRITGIKTQLCVYRDRLQLTNILPHVALNRTWKIIRGNTLVRYLHTHAHTHTHTVVQILECLIETPPNFFCLPGDNYQGGSK